MLNNLEKYNQSTEDLVVLAEDYDISVVNNKHSFPDIVRALRESFKYKITYKKVFGEHRMDNADPSFGYCLVGSYYIFEKTGRDLVWTIKKNPVHWWLKHKTISGEYDIAHTQFDKPFPYYMSINEIRLDQDESFRREVFERAMILGRCAGLE